MVVGVLEVFGRLQQRLGGMQPTLVQVPPGGRPGLVLPFVDTGHVHAQLGGADGGDVATRAGADDDDIELFAHKNR